MEHQTPMACKYIVDNSGVSDKLSPIGLNVEYVGTIVSDAIKDGCLPMVW